MVRGGRFRLRTVSFGRHGRNADFGVCAGVRFLTFAVAVVGLFTLPASDQVVTVFSAVEALEDGDPHGLLAGLLFRLRGVVVPLHSSGVHFFAGGGTVSRVCFVFVGCFITSNVFSILKRLGYILYGKL